MRLLAFVLVLFAIDPAFAATDPLRKFSRYGRVVNATLDATSTSFAVNLDNPEIGGIFGMAVLWACVTDADNGVTAITASCSASYDNGTTDYTAQEGAVASGVYTSVDASWVHNPGAATTCWPWRWDIEGYPEIECTFTDTGGDSSDRLTVYLSFATKG